MQHTVSMTGSQYYISYCVIKRDSPNYWVSVVEHVINNVFFFSIFKSGNQSTKARAIPHL